MPPSDSAPDASSSGNLANSSSRQLEQAQAGWTSRLTFAVVLGLAFEATTGLWMAFAPFSVFSQLQVVGHTIGGLLLTAPCLIYLWRHYIAWRSQTLSVVKLIGYAAMGLTMIGVASGLVVSCQSVFGRKLSPLWDEIHLVTGIGLVVLIVLHLAFAWTRRREALGATPAFVQRFRRNALVAGGTLAGGAVLLLLAGTLVPRVVADRPLPKAYTLPAYAQNFAEYRGSPFAPTYARTATARLINPEVLANSASCGTAGCHEQILAEWEPSAHRFSAMNPPFQAVQKKFAHDRSPAETRYCAGCHDPISLFAGAKDVANMSLSAPGMQEGSSCAVCHAISQVDQRGNADYVVTAPTKYLGESGRGVAKTVSDFLIRAYPRQHLADYNRAVLRTPEFCGACHKQFIPEALNHFGASPAQNQYDEWRKSHWADTAHPDKNLSCRDCHMRLVQDSQDPGAGQAGDPRRKPTDGAHRHHGFIATNLFMPELLKLPHREEHDRLTKEWIEGKTVLPEIAREWPTGPAASIELVAPPRATPGQKLEVQALVRNRKAGHNFITGPLDFIRAWIHLRIIDAEGNTVAEWGGIDPVTRDILDQPGVLHVPSGPRNQGTMVLESLPLDAEGNVIVRHDLWRKAGGSGLRVIFPGYVDKQSYSCTVPANARGPLRIQADLDFRRYRQEFLNLMVPDMERTAGVYQPTVVAASATSVVELIPGSPTRASAPLASTTPR